MLHLWIYHISVLENSLGGGGLNLVSVCFAVCTQDFFFFFFFLGGGGGGGESGSLPPS